MNVISFFAGCGGLDLGFDVSSKYKLKEVGIDKDKINIQERFAPYITTYKELISTK